MIVRLRAAALFLAAASLSSTTLSAQNTLDRTPLLSGGWVGTPGNLQINAPFRFSKLPGSGLDVFVVPSFQVSLGLPASLLIGGQYAAQSPVVNGDAGEWEAFARWKPVAEARGAPLDVAVQAGYNGAAHSMDAELSLSRWLGPVRLMGAGRVFSDAFRAGDTRGALAGGAVLYPAPRTMPIALSGDVGMMLDEEDGEELAWSGGILVGIPYTVNTVSLFATNTASGTLQGVSRGGGRTRYGMEITIPIPLGRFVGWYPSREAAREAVKAPPAPTARVVHATIYRYAYVQDVIEIDAGTTIEWTNQDAMVHTVSSDDTSWNSGAIAPGKTWSATFSQPGTYPFHCGPHPFMKGAVVVH